MTQALRDYQSLAVEAVKADNSLKPIYYRLPTGTGKTPVAGMLAQHYADQGRVLFLAHRIDLVDQGVRQMQEWTHFAVGKVQADAKQYGARITVACTATLRNSTIEHWLTSPNLFDQDLQNISLVLIDECHHATASNGYGTIIRAIREHSPDVKVVGCTATPFRNDSEDMLFKTCVFDRSIPDMQQAGWLSPIRWQRLGSSIDLASIRKSGDDYNSTQLGELMTSHVQEVVELTTPLLGNRKTVVFAASVEHARQLAATYNIAGVSASVVWGEMPSLARQMAMWEWKQGDTQIMCNFGILTEGFDYPELSGMVMARPTQSPGLYLQMLGRGTRLAQGKEDCLVLDLTGNPNLLDTRQITLTAVLPYYEEDLLPDADGSILLGASRNPDQPFKLKKPKSLRINDPVGRSKVPWGYDLETDCYYASLTENQYAILLKNPRSGLYHGGILNGDYIKRAYDNPLPLSEAVGHIHHIIAANGIQAFIDKRAGWRAHPASDAQLKLLRWKDPAAHVLAIKDHWTKGEVAQAINWAMIRQAVRGAKVRLG